MKNDQFFADFFARFEPMFQQVITRMPAVSQDTSFSSDLITTFLNPVTPYVQSGKRIRPFLIAVGANSVEEPILHAGIAFELLHTFALVHDDIMDGANLRRNVPTVHVAFNQQGFAGESGAILVGDFLLAYANEHMSQHVPELMPIFTKTQRFLCVGQFYEMMHWDKRVEPEVSKNISRFKSAQYTFMYPLQFGLQLAGKNVNQLDEYADNTGLAFQMRDDWLDISEEIDTGKDKNLDDKNSVPNMVQNIFHTHDQNIPSTKTEVEKQLQKYKTAALSSLETVTLSEKQRNSLVSLLELSTTI